MQNPRDHAAADDKHHGDEGGDLAERDRECRQDVAIKRSDALLCDVLNERISDRLLQRWGWERHVLDSPRRHHIKRFYGEYPPAQPDWGLFAAAE
jgi:hypothetical protein